MQAFPAHLTEFLARLVEADPSLSPTCRAFILGGKRLRAALLFAAADIPDTSTSDQLATAAAAIELVHAASLVHDDIVDRCAERRGHPSLHRALGVATANRTAIYLVHRALQLLGSLPEWARLRVAETAQALARGQWLELLHAGDVAHRVETRVEIMTLKTASVFGLACELGSRLSGMETSTVDAHGRFGAAFGMLFQIADDVDDLFAPQHEQGRLPATDLRCAVMSLPIVFALDTPTRPRVARLLELERADLSVLAACRTLVLTSGALDRTIDLATQYADEARHALARTGLDVRSPWLGDAVDGTLRRVERFRDVHPAGVTA